MAVKNCPEPYRIVPRVEQSKIVKNAFPGAKDFRLELCCVTLATQQSWRRPSQHDSARIGTYAEAF
jgi:hypothetical protein